MESVPHRVCTAVQVQIGAILVLMTSASRRRVDIPWDKSRRVTGGSGEGQVKSIIIAVLMRVIRRVQGHGICTSSG